MHTIEKNPSLKKIFIDSERESKAIAIMLILNNLLAIVEFGRSIIMSEESINSEEKVENYKQLTNTRKHERNRETILKRIIANYTNENEVIHSSEYVIHY